jgi:hypothetical protein
MIGVSALSPALLGVAGALGNTTLTWNASPLVWPRFDPLVALSLVPLLFPLVRLPRRVGGAVARSTATAPEPAVVAP